MWNPLFRVIHSILEMLTLINTVTICASLLIKKIIMLQGRLVFIIFYSRNVLRKN